MRTRPDQVLLILCLLLFVTISCKETSTQKYTDSSHVEQPEADPVQLSRINPDGEFLLTRILPPEGYRRIQVPDNSFPTYLRSLSLKPNGSEVLYYNGEAKWNNEVYDAVVDLPIGTKDLHQCADAVMRLRADYLWNKGDYDRIHFNFTNGFRVDYSKWMEGYRVAIQGNSTKWVMAANPSNSPESFWKYMELIFSYAGTLSLSEEMNEIELSDMQIGDVFIQGGSPGHAVLIVDIAKNDVTGEEIFLLAQSYMPAQEIQILKNPSNDKMSPWYSMDFGIELQTPEWQFKGSDLKRFTD